jgi:hypothetical protein
MSLIKHFVYASILLASLVLIGCSSAANTSNEGNAAGPRPPSRSVPAEFGKQTATLDQYCTNDEGDLHTKVQGYTSKVQAKTGKKLDLQDVYTRMAGLAPHVTSVGGKYNCDQLIFRALLEMAPEMGSQQAIEDLP